jgi:hypothetical protein
LESKGLKKVIILLCFLLPATVMWVSCGYTPSGNSQTSGVKYRAFITNNVSSGTAVASVAILDAQNDIRANASPITAGNTPGMMVVTPNRAQTLVFSGSGTQSSDNLLSLINNASEQNASHITLPGMTESIVVSPDSSAAYIALPTAEVIGQSPGIVEAITMNGGAVTGQVNVPAVHYMSSNHSGNRIFGFSDNSDLVSVITPSQIGIGNAVTTMGGPGILDRPVAAFFSSDDNTAYVVSCGAECGGTQASLQQLDITKTPPVLVASVPVCVNGTTQCGASEALLSGSTMYLAGSYANLSNTLPCPEQTVFSPTCGVLSVVDLTTMSVTASGIAITDGYHNRIALGANGQLFIGARTCTQTIGTSGCLSIYNTQSFAVGSVQPGAVLIPAANGDVTGIEPIATRQVVYVVQGGSLFIYDATKDALYLNPHDSNNPGQIFGLVGNFIDVKTIDF